MNNMRSEESDGSRRSGAEMQGVLMDQAQAAGAKLADAAQQIGSQTKEAFGSLASETGERVQGYMNQQVAAGAGLVEELAKSIRVAADNLEQKSPMLSGAMRGGADKVHELANRARNRSVDDLLADAGDFARRKPALVFTGAAAFGFLAFRLLNASLTQAQVRPSQSPGPQPTAPESSMSSFTQDAAATEAPLQPFEQPIGEEGFSRKRTDQVHGR